MTGTLFLVGTPIGNLEDLSDRARRVLGSVDAVAAEDTRRTGRLLQRIGIKVRLVSYFEGNEAERVPQLLGRLTSGESIALVSDAGMPAVSDPGYRLVAECVRAGVPIDVVPGPSAALAGLVVSGLPTDRFVFEGFLPRSGRARRERVEALAKEPRTIVLFESPRRVGATLVELADALGAGRRAALARELTKLHQEVLRGRLGELVELIDGRELKGEVVLVVEGVADGAGGSEEATERAIAVARTLAAAGSRKRDAAKEASRATGVPTAQIYRALVDGPQPGP